MIDYTKNQAKDLLIAAKTSIDKFLASSEARDIDWRQSKLQHIEYLQSRLTEIQRWINDENQTSEIGPLADARNIYWDEPETSLQKEYCDNIFKLFNFLRKQKIGLQ